MDNTSKVLFAALVGAAAGVVAGIMLAPASGKETRKNISKQSKKLKDELSKNIDDLQEKGAEIIEKIKAKAETSSN